MSLLSRFNTAGMIALLGRLLALVLIALLAWRAAALAWHFIAPPPQPLVPELRAEVNLANISRLAWFGAEPAAGIAVAVKTELKLIGVFAGGQRPAAIIAVGSQNPAAFALGEEIAGSKLIKIEADHVLLEQDGRSDLTTRIDLPAPLASIAIDASGKETPRK